MLGATGVALDVVGVARFCVAGTVGSKLQGRKRGGGLEVDKRTQVDVKCQVGWGGKAG